MKCKGPTPRVTIWDTYTGKEDFTTSLRDPRERDNCGRAGKWCSFVFSPDGRWLASAEWCDVGNDANRYYGGEVVLLDSATGKVRWTISGDPDSAELLRELAFSPDGKLLATGSRSSIKLWDVDTGCKVLTINSPVLACGRLPSSGALSFSPDGQQLASANDRETVTIWNVSSGSEVLTLKGQSVITVAFAPDGKRLASGGRDSTVRVWDIMSGQEVLTLRGHTCQVPYVAFDSDGWCLRSVDESGVLKVWDSAMSHEWYSLSGHTERVNCLAFSHDGRLLASGSSDRSVKIWDVVTKRLVRTLDGHPSWVKGIVFSSDGKRLAAVGDGGFVRVWDVSAGEELVTLNDSDKDLHHAVFSPDGHHLATVAWGGGVVVWELESRRAVWMDQPERGHFGASTAAFSSDGQRLAFDVGGRVQVWDLIQKKEVLAFDSNAAISTIVYSPDGRYIVSGGGDGTIQFWNVANGENIRTFQSFAGDVCGLAFSVDGRRLLSVHGSTSTLWDMATGQEVWNWDGTVALGPDCTHIAFLAWNNQIGILEGVPLTPETNVHLEASGLVQFLFGKEPDKHCVLTIIRDTATISEIVRDEALTLAEHWQPSCDASELNSASWSTVRRPDATPDQYQLALQQAEMICGLGPENGLYLNTLGVAQYRVGRYQETIDTLLRADKINGGIPADLAFLAMAQYRLEQKGQAQSTLALLRQAIEKSKQTVDKDTQNFLREAETLIGEPASDSRVKNKDQTTETEDR